MKSLFIFFSDIHYKDSAPENEGAILKAFVKDVDEQVKQIPHDEVKYFIGGDLVNKADDDKYEALWDKVLKKLPQVSDANNYIIVPGNHDVMQSKVSEVWDSFKPVRDSKHDESKFNNLIHSEQQNSSILAKFTNFDTFMAKHCTSDNYSTLSYGRPVNDNWSVFCLNTSLFASGALENDYKLLGANTRDLYQWLESTAGKKILLMHHPADWMLDWASHEVKKLITTEFDLVLSGHTHDQNLLCNVLGKDSYIHCMAPKLCPNKDETLGYCIIEIEDDIINRIIYRGWSERRNRFQSGGDFTEPEDGIIVLHEHKVNEQKDDLVEQTYVNRFNDAMLLYGNKPTQWVDRLFTKERVDGLLAFADTELISEQNMLNQRKSFHIVAPPQYGLTCFGYHFLLTAWRQGREFGVFLNAKNKRRNKLVNAFKNELELFGKEYADVKWVVIDNWAMPRDEKQATIRFLKENCEDAPVLFMTSLAENVYDDEDTIVIGEEASENLYMTPLKRQQERQLVESFNRENYIAEEDVVLSRLDNDLTTFNMHRTPFNCATLLTIFNENSFDEEPVNRTDVLEKVLRMVFDNIEGVPTYTKKAPDLKDCEYCLGNFCQRLITDKKRDYFSEDEFKKAVEQCCDEMSFDVNASYLFDILRFHRIIVPFGVDYTFRFSIWVHYFAALAMYNDDEFNQKMLDRHNYVHYPEVLEFYTGKDRKRSDAVKTVTEDLLDAVDSVVKKSGIPADKNPFNAWRLKKNEEATGRILSELESNVQNSNLPKEIKDSVADKTFNPSAAFHQQMYKAYDDFTFGYLKQITEIASKTLRNSEFVKSEDKKKLLDTIVNSWSVMSMVIYLVSPLFAKQGFIRLHDYTLKLTDAFDKYEDKEKMVQIILTIPYNMMLFFKEDIFSAKLSRLFVSQFELEPDKVKKHLLASLLVVKCPDGWMNAIEKYVGNIGAESYYLVTLFDLMLWSIRNNELQPGDRARMNTALKTALYKIDNKMMPQSIAQLKGLPQ